MQDDIPFSLAVAGFNLVTMGMDMIRMMFPLQLRNIFAWARTVAVALAAIVTGSTLVGLWAAPTVYFPILAVGMVMIVWKLLREAVTLAALILDDLDNEHGSRFHAVGWKMLLLLPPDPKKPIYYLGLFVEYAASCVFPVVCYLAMAG
jgi:hypothetical protein